MFLRPIIIASLCSLSISLLGMQNNEAHNTVWSHFEATIDTVTNDKTTRYMVALYAPEKVTIDPLSLKKPSDYPILYKELINQKLIKNEKTLSIIPLDLTTPFTKE